ncbi:hypothetical protein [Dyadobacter crusticola]|uniref:hypothetical protein n=1 Tax=Dyadobacter crusticola TaxID=292407 RepID=UPI0004E1AFC4|nr:hypothetical protein [Dyadobacter crusticola]
MVNLNRVFIYILAIVAISCSKTEVDSSNLDESYFVGTWTISRDVTPSVSNADQVSFTLNKGGYLKLNIIVPSVPGPIYQWNFAAAKKELTIITTSEERYIVTQHSDRTFKARNLATNNPFVFKRI